MTGADKEGGDDDEPDAGQEGRVRVEDAGEGVELRQGQVGEAGKGQDS